MPRILGASALHSALIAIPILAAVGSVSAQLNHGCAPVAAAEFKMTTVVARATGINEPIKMALDADALGNVDIYFVERMGAVKKFSGATKAVTDIGAIPIFIGYEDGLTGIALDPAFKTNKALYLYWGAGTTEKFMYRVARFVLGADGKLDKASEKTILEVPATASRMHTGGAMAFDPEGNLWITTGENQSGEEGPPNTNDLRGKILRIKPKPEGGYTVPAGNLFPAGMEKTRPEIYVMGARNPYSISLDPVRKGISWGDIGPDGKGLTEEHNFTTKPGNFGYPYFAGDNIKLMGTGTVEKPLNTNSKNTGLQELPPAIPAINPYKQEAAITGPIYRYNSVANTPVKMPPHFDGLWFMTDFQTGAMDTIRLNPAGTAILAKGVAFPSMRLERPVDMQMGPDGAIYIMNYAGWFGPAAGTGIVRIEYTGACRIPVGIAQAPIAPSQGGFRALGWSVAVSAPGVHALDLADLQGRSVASFKSEGPARHDVAAASGIRAGAYIATLRTASGSVSRRIVLGN